MATLKRGRSLSVSLTKLLQQVHIDAIGSRPRGLSAAAGPDPVGGLVPRHHVTDATDAAVFVADHGEPTSEMVDVYVCGVQSLAL